MYIVFHCFPLYVGIHGTCSGRGALYTMAEQRLRTVPLKNEEERQRKARALAKEAKQTFSTALLAQEPLSTRLTSIVGFQLGTKHELRGLWWQRHSQASHACRVIQAHWWQWWRWTCRQRGAMSFQSVVRGFFVRVRFWRKRDRLLQKRREKNARQLMQRVGKGHAGRKKAAKRKIQVNRVNMMFAKAMVDQARYTYGLWKRHAYVQRQVRRMRLLIFQRKRTSRLVNAVAR